jgi:hypothetical protein
VFEYLCIIWGRYADPNTITAELLSPAGSGTLTKAFYFLLHQHRSSMLEERGIFMDIDEPSLLNARGEKFVTRLYMAPLSKKPRPLSADNTPAPISGFAFPLHTSDERMSTAPPAYQPMWAQGPRRMRPGSPAGPRAHRPRPISSPPPAHALSHPSLTAPNMSPLSNPSSPSHARTFYGGPRVPPAAAYIEQPNPFVSSGQAHPHQHSTGYMVPLGPITASPLSGTLAPVSAPRISNATFQRTIDDIAGRMNVLNAAFARAQIQARADAAQAHARFRTLPMLGQYPAPSEVGAEKELAHVHEALSGGDKENASIEQGSSGRRRPSTSHTAEEGQVLGGIGFGKANGSGALGKEIGNIAIPPEAVTRIKKDRRSKRKSPRSSTHLHSYNNHVAPSLPPAAPTLDLHDSTPRSNDGSPVLGSPKTLLVPPAVGEVKGWFSSLFHWRTHAVALRSRDSVASTRAEARRLLAPVLLSEPQADGALRARLEDAYDPSTGHIVQKAVRFRVEFAVGRGSSGGGCTMTLVQEKGSVSAFRALCARLRAEWMLDALEPQTPGMPPTGFGGEDADSRLVNV